MPDSSAPLARLRQRLLRLERAQKPARALFALGCGTLDARIGGGLARGALHEATAGEAAGANGFALMLALRAADAGKPLLFVRSDRTARGSGALYGPGLAELGIDPARLILVHAADETAALQAAADIIGCMGIGAAIVEAGAAKKLDLTASRKLALAAQSSGVAVFIVREGEARFASAASTRWAVSPAPSVHEEGAPGRTMLRVELIRHRGGVAPFETLLEWDRDRQAFRTPALSGAVLPVAERGQMAA